MLAVCIAHLYVSTVLSSEGEKNLLDISLHLTITKTDNSYAGAVVQKNYSANDFKSPESSH